VLLFIIIAGCPRPQDKIFTIGIIKSSQKLRVIQGFKEGMTERGYIEGRNIKYIFREIDEKNEQDVNEGIKEFFAQDVDILVGETGSACLRGHKLIKGTATSLLFLGEARPVEAGLVKSLTHPGGNITGVRTPDTIPKALECMKLSIPSLNNIYVPYNPYDKISVTEPENMEQAASHLGH